MSEGCEEGELRVLWRSVRQGGARKQVEGGFKRARGAMAACHPAECRPVCWRLILSCPDHDAAHPPSSNHLLSHPLFPPNSVVSRRQLAAQAAVAKRLAAAAERGGYGVPEASLHAAHRQLAEAEVGDYSRIFSPEEVADILAGAPGGCACDCVGG